VIRETAYNAKMRMKWAVAVCVLTVMVAGLGILTVSGRSRRYIGDVTLRGKKSNFVGQRALYV